MTQARKAGSLVEFFTGDVRVKDIPFMFDLFVTTPPAPAAFFFPVF